MRFTESLDSGRISGTEDLWDPPSLNHTRSLEKPSMSNEIVTSIGEVVQIPDSNEGVEYRIVPEFPAYAVGDDGSVWSRQNNRWGYGDWKRMSPTKIHGYPTVYLSGNGRTKRVLVHRIVLETFIGPCPDGMECRHFPDNDRSNNNLNNIQWGTRLENRRDRIAQGTEQYGERNHRAKLTREVVVEIREKYAAGGVRQIDLAKEYGVSKRAVGMIVNGKRWGEFGGPITDGSSRKAKFTKGCGIVRVAGDTSEDKHMDRILRVGISREKALEIKSAHCSGMSLCQISLEFDCSERIAKFICEKAVI